MKINWSKIGWGFLKILAILLINCVSIFFIVAKIIDFEVTFNGKVLEISLIDYWRWLGVWHWYYSLLMYFGIALGLFGTFKLLQLFHTQTKEKKRDEKDDKFKSDIKKILGGK